MPIIESVGVVEKEEPRRYRGDCLVKESLETAVLELLFPTENSRL